MVEAGRYINRPSVIISVGRVAGGGEHALALRRIADVGGETLAAALGGDGRHDGILVIEHGRKIDFDPTQGRGKFQAPGARVESGPDAEHGGDAVRRTVSGTRRSRKRLRTPIPKHIDVEAGEGARDGHAAASGQLRGEGIADQAVGTLRLHGAAGGGHQRGVADVGDLVGFRLHGFHVAISYDQRMPEIRNSTRLVLPVLLLLVLYWPGLNTWFYQDDFGWLSLRHDVHSAGDLARAMFAPKAHGNMRPLGENAYWLGLGAIFGVAPLPFHICTFLTQSASLLLLGSIVRRLVAWTPGGLCAQILWLVNIGVAPAMGWSSIYNQVLSAFFFLLAFYFLLRRIETGGRAYEMAHWAAFVLGLGALEINVVYPALAALYVWFHARPLLKKILPMFAVSAAAVLLHFYFAPPAHAGVYAPHVDAAIGATIWTYWRWVLGPMPEIAAGLMAVCAMVLTVWGLRRGESTALLGAAWFVFPLLPYLPLPEHKMDYYLAVPSIGIAMLGAYAIARVRKFGGGGKNRDGARDSGVYGDFGAGGVDGDAMAARTGRKDGRPGARSGGSSSGGEGEDHFAGRDR